MRNQKPSLLGCFDSEEREGIHGDWGEGENTYETGWRGNLDFRKTPDSDAQKTRYVAKLGNFTLSLGDLPHSCFHCSTIWMCDSTNTLNSPRTSTLGNDPTTPSLPQSLLER